MAHDLPLIGEFSFILAALGMALGLLPAEGRDLILAGALISITLNPLVFRFLGSRREPPVLPSPHEEKLAPAGHVILAGHGRVGRVVAKSLAKSGAPFVVIEQNRDRVEKLRKRGWQVLEGDATSATVMALANIEGARAVVIAIPNAAEARRVFELVRGVNETARMIVRSETEEEQGWFRERGAELAPMAEQELGRVMAERLASA